MLLGVATKLTPFPAGILSGIHSGSQHHENTAPGKHEAAFTFHAQLALFLKSACSLSNEGSRHRLAAIKIVGAITGIKLLQYFAIEYALAPRDATPGQKSFSMSRSPGNRFGAPAYWLA